MAKKRKDPKGRTLRKGESYRASDGSYMYRYTDTLKKSHAIYSKDLVELRERVERLCRDQADGIDVYVAGKSDLNTVWDRYISTKSELKRTTYSNYVYMYDHFIRDGFGKKKVAEIKYSDVLFFYNHLLVEEEMQVNSLETINTILHPTFELAVRDGIIRNNPSKGVMRELKRKNGNNAGIRKALTIEQTSKYLFEQVYLGTKSIEDIDWAKKITEAKFANEVVDKFNKVIKELDGKYDKDSILNAIKKVFLK